MDLHSTLGDTDVHMVVLLEYNDSVIADNRNQSNASKTN